VTAAVRASRALDVPVTGLDFLVPDVGGPDHVLIEANERPGLANHQPQPTAERFVDLLFPETTALPAGWSADLRPGRHDRPEAGAAAQLPIDMDYVQEVLLHLLRTPSPTGRTDEVVHYFGELVMDLGMDLRSPAAACSTRPVGQAHPPGPRHRRARRHHRIMVTRLKDTAARGYAARHAQRPLRRGRARHGLHRHPESDAHRHGAAAKSTATSTATRSTPRASAGPGRGARRRAGVQRRGPGGHRDPGRRLRRLDANPIITPPGT
jgi:hypothetical protein